MVSRITACVIFVSIVSCGGAVTDGSSDASAGKLMTNPDGSPTGNGKTCTYGGLTTNVGGTFKAPDGCNECSCTADGAVCTERACSGGGSCTYEGKTFRVGESWTIPNPQCPAAAAHCQCGSAGTVACAAPAIACVDPVPPPDRCKDDQGLPRNAGETWFDGCNTCSCADNGAIACTKKACKCPPAGTIDCQPVVPPEREQLCAQPYRGWIQKNCPGVKYVD